LIYLHFQTMTISVSVTHLKSQYVSLTTIGTNA